MQDSAVASSPPVRTVRHDTFRTVRLIVAVLLIAYLLWRLYSVLTWDTWGADTWVQWLRDGIARGSMYAVVALGYTLVYGVLFMINFAHGEIMMFGAFSGFFIFEALNAIVVDPATGQTLLDARPALSVLLALLGGMSVSMVAAFFLERIAYRPLRGAPRLVPLISAIGASIFLRNAAQLLFGPETHYYQNPSSLPHFERGVFNIMVAGEEVIIPDTAILTLGVSLLLVIGLNILVQRTRLGRAMRAVAEDKKTAALMGIDVDQVISRTFMISGVLAGAAGVMWGIHLKNIDFAIGALPGIKAFTAAVLGGIGNISGAMLGGMVLGIVEALGPAALGLPQEVKDVIAFSVLVLVLLFRPSGILGEVLTEEKV